MLLEEEPVCAEILQMDCGAPLTWACAYTHLHTEYLPTHIKRNVSDLKSSRTIVLSHQANGTTLQETCLSSGLGLAQGCKDYLGPTCFPLSPSPPTGSSC